MSSSQVSLSSFILRVQAGSYRLRSEGESTSEEVGWGCIVLVHAQEKMALYEDRESNENKCPYLKANRANLVKFTEHVQRRAAIILSNNRDE